MVSKRWWWTSSDGNDFANTFVGLLIIFIIFAPGKGNVNPITFTTTPRKHEGYPTPSLGGGGRREGEAIQGKFG